MPDSVSFDRAAEVYDLPHYPLQLPESLAMACRSLVRQLGLRFGAIDLVQAADGDYVFLEINPNGQWLWIQDETGLPIAEALCTTLLDPAGHAPAPFPSHALEAHP